LSVIVYYRLMLLSAAYRKHIICGSPILRTVTLGLLITRIVVLGFVTRFRH
jgi:hypothetical protein